MIRYSKMSYFVINHLGPEDFARRVHPLYAATLIFPGGGYTSILLASGLKYCLETEAVI